MKILNMTPHEINLVVGGKIIAIAPSGVIARVSAELEELPPIEAVIGGETVEIPQSFSTFGEIENLPEPEEGVILVVSRMVAQAALEQLGRYEDIRVPNGSVRDDEGRIIGCESLAPLKK